MNDNLRNWSQNWWKPEMIAWVICWSYLKQFSPARALMRIQRGFSHQNMGVHIISDAIINYSGKSMIIGRITNIIWIIIIHMLHRDNLSAIGRIWVKYHSLTTTAQKLMLSKRLSAGHFMISYYELVCKEKLQLP